MARKQSLFHVELWDKAAEMIDSLPEKPKSEVKKSVKDGISRIKNSINKAKKLGYTNEEILETLKKSGIEVSMTSFKTYLGKKVKKKNADKGVSTSKNNTPKN